MVEPLRHRQTKGAATDMPGLLPPRHIPTLPFSATQPSRWEWLFLPLNGHLADATPGRHAATAPHLDSTRLGGDVYRSALPLLKEDLPRRYGAQSSRSEPNQTGVCVRPRYKGRPNWPWPHHIGAAAMDVSPGTSSGSD